MSKALSLKLSRLPQLSKLVLGYVLFVGVFCTLRVFFCNQTLGWDEAEQVVFAQELTGGYLVQPPLYSWLQYLVFQCLGVNLFSLSVLKFSLLFACFYCYHQICRLYCKDKLLSYSATLSWFLIPTISIDLLPHRTHSILALLAACLTWYWLVRPSRLAKNQWYIGLGVIVGIGFLSKFNYLLFLIFLLISLSSIKEYRRDLLQAHSLLSFVVALLIASPYWFWLINNTAPGFYGTSKLFPSDMSLWDGLIHLFKAIFFFIIPFFFLILFFPFKRQSLVDKKTKLLQRYHFIAIPLLVIIAMLGGINDIKPHWVLILLFLSPLAFFSFIDEANYSADKAKRFIKLCFFAGILLIGIWIIHQPRLARFPLQAFAEKIKQEKQDIVVLASDSLWLLGCLMFKLSIPKGILLHPTTPTILSSENLLIAWRETRSLAWLENKVFPNRPNCSVKSMLNGQQTVIAEYAYCTNRS
jgi:4-amino-4-deoxy-L-arabinose transferase-like glycosyltransferase